MHYPGLSNAENRSKIGSRNADINLMVGDFAVKGSESLRLSSFPSVWYRIQCGFPLATCTQIGLNDQGALLKFRRDLLLLNGMVTVAMF